MQKLKRTTHPRQSELFMTRPMTQSTRKGATKYYLRLKDKTEVMQKCGDAALILYEFYISKSGHPDYSFDDDVVAKALQWNISKVKRYRLELRKKDYFFQQTGRMNNGPKCTITYLDPNEIKQIRSQRQTKALTSAAIQRMIESLQTSPDIEPEVDELDAEA